MTTRRSASNVKVLHSGYTFTGSKSFPSGILPTKCQVLERIIQFENFRTLDVANDVAKEIHDRWVWCNVYLLHYLTISKKVQALVVAFSKLDRYPKKKRGASFLEKEAEFLSDIDKLFDVSSIWCSECLGIAGAGAGLPVRGCGVCVNAGFV